MRKFVIGDIHGAHKALVQCLERSKFNNEEDLLIFLGDVADGWPEAYETVEELSKIKNLVYIKGNHDIWLQQWFKGKSPDPTWLQHGGKSTLASYKNGIPDKHKRFITSPIDYHIESDYLFIHGGYLPGLDLKLQDEGIFCWDRTIALQILQNEDPQITDFGKVFLGHTPIMEFGFDKPLERYKVVMMDTGAGWGEKLSMVDLTEGTLFQSDKTSDLYPGYEGRK